MAHILVQVDGRELFNDNIEGFHLPPELPNNPTPGPGFRALPKQVQVVLAKAMEKVLEKKIGFKRVRIDP